MSTAKHFLHFAQLLVGKTGQELYNPVLDIWHTQQFQWKGHFNEGDKLYR